MKNTPTLRSKIGASKGQPHSRVWIEGKRLLESGFTVGTRYQRTPGPGIVLRIHPQGGYKVSGKGEKPVIDITGKIVAEKFPPPATHVLVTYMPKLIAITPAPKFIESNC